LFGIAAAAAAVERKKKEEEEGGGGGGGAADEARSARRPRRSATHQERCLSGSLRFPFLAFCVGRGFPGRSQGY